MHLRRQDLALLDLKNSNEKSAEACGECICIEIFYSRKLKG